MAAFISAGSSDDKLTSFISNDDELCLERDVDDDEEDDDSERVFVDFRLVSGDRDGSSRGENGTDGVEFFPPCEESAAMHRLKTQQM